jgi:hypothetical protein
MTVKEGLNKAEGGLPREAFAVVGDSEDPETWKLPHHKKSILRALRSGADIEKTVDWDRMASAVVALSPRGGREWRVSADPEEILRTAGHLAAHYRKAGKPLPDILAALV